MKKILIVSIVLIICLSGVCSAAWYSSNPSDLSPLKNSIWAFSYRNSGIDYFDAVEFLNKTFIHENEAILPCLNLDEWIGMTKYGEYMGTSKEGFVCLFLNASMDRCKIYQFDVIGSLAVGSYIYFNRITEYMEQAALIGTRLGYFDEDALKDIDPIQVDFDQNQPVEPVEIDQNLIDIDFDQNQPIQFDQNQSMDANQSINVNDGNNDSGGSCFIQALNM